MATINEFSIWEPNIYELETTDLVIGGPTGISNLSRQQLTNRTRKIYDVLVENGVFITESNHEFVGQNIDVTAVFEGSVVDGNVVFYDDVQLRYEKALAGTGGNDEHFVGIADVTNGRVVSGGLITVNISGANNGDIVYLDGTTPGLLTVTPSNVPVGKVLWFTAPTVAVMALNSGVGGSGLGGFDPEQDTYRMLLNDSFFDRGSYDGFRDTDLVDLGQTDGTYDFAENLWNLTSGQDLVSLNLRDPLASGNVTEAYISIDSNLTGQIWLSANGGTNWEVVSNKTIHSFANPGTDLRIWYRATGTDVVRSWGILYEQNPGGPLGGLQIPHSQLIQDEPQYHFTVGSINHSAINDDEPTQHRIINDAGVSTTQLWSSNKINSEISAAAGGGGIRVYDPVMSPFPAINRTNQWGAVGSSPVGGFNWTMGRYWIDEPTPAGATFAYTYIPGQHYFRWEVGDPRYIIYKGQVIGMPTFTGIRLLLDGSSPGAAQKAGTTGAWDSFLIYIDMNAYGAGWHELLIEHSMILQTPYFGVRNLELYWNTVVA